MIYLKHINTKTVSSVVKDGEQIQVLNTNLILCFWEICERFPDELVIWIDEKIDMVLSDDLHTIFHHDLIMASYPIESKFFPDSIGYIDQFPFVNPDHTVRYPTWRMSTDVGGIKTQTALKFKSIFQDIKNFGYLLNSIAKVGQQNSLFCYNEPDLIKENYQTTLESRASISLLFNFVSQHYKNEWLFVLLFCFIKYERQLPFWSFFKSHFKRSWFRKTIDLSDLTLAFEKTESLRDTIDILIPTIGRPEYLRQVVLDLKAQTHLPSKLIIIEQEPDLNSKTQLDFLYKEDWPFEIVHRLIHHTGACNARNLAMQQVTSDWVFFADDDIRLTENVIEKALEELHRLNICALNLNCIQPGEEIYFEKIKQWAAFGSGTSIVRSSHALKCQFSEALEFGFGEDIDFGLQLRSHGCDIIYQPEVKIIHLKAGSGGFRDTLKAKWANSSLEPKPSPTMMWLVKKYYSSEMIRGYKVSLFLKFYKKQKLRNPLKYIQLMKRRWDLSEQLSDKLPRS
ncbi:glycosyltransferase family 2 protein [Christiangramia forsetii]|uniref:Glycosyl transferase, family 2 n=2 Tax=Christiangramia forsetii TaxID=411153 RepID=A0LYW4_CHRFK|nr:glycosyltransferase [Christiangramia forsetii]GGG33195.1 glycosyl transferase [Christiangramia forsetii]CAL65559.1 glycosyl transferase, family 2 [Christiangramia forsetii KT0803]